MLASKEMSSDLNVQASRAKTVDPLCQLQAAVSCSEAKNLLLAALRAETVNLQRRRGPSGYVGLVNLGATCYANSVFQQLFMQPAIRQLILGGPEDAPGAPSNPSVFGQLQAWPRSASRDAALSTVPNRHLCQQSPWSFFPY